MIFSVGHSTRRWEEFVALLDAHSVRQVADVRTVPKSRRQPHFNRNTLAENLAAHGIYYRHFPALGGLRTPRADSINTAWQHPGFRGYADHMQTEEFRRGLAELLQFASSALTSVLCAEAVWWKCHRRLLSDALVARGTPVLHLLSAAGPKPHELSEFARVRDGAVTYPGLL